jgi:integrase
MVLTSLSVIQRSRKLESLPKVRGFLESISRNSIKLKRSYSSGIILFQNFLDYNKQQQQEEAHQEREKYQDYSCETILQPLVEARLNVYELFNDFVSFILTTKPDITPKSVSLYITAIRSYFAFYDIDVIPSKFKRKVKMPKFYREDEEAIDTGDIRNILLNCNNRRLKAYLLILASSGMRAVEATAVRLKDIDFSVSIF